MLSRRELVMQHVAKRMVAVFTQGDLIDAQNINAFLGSLEGMTDAEYEEIAAEETSGAIS